MKDLLLTLSLSFISIFIRAFVLMKIWIWYISPYFNIKNINIKEAIGFFLFVFMITHSGTNKKKLEMSDRIEAFMLLIAIASITLSYAYLFKIIL